MPTKKPETKKEAVATPAVPPDIRAALAAPEDKAPKPKYAENDNSIDARMWRLEQDHIRMGSR